MGPVDGDLVLADIIEITCLVLEEGGQCEFLHRSIQEYYAARFVARLPEEVAKEFYNAMCTSGHEWDNVLSFLAVIDAFRYRESFLLPASRQHLEIPGDPELVDESVVDRLLQVTFPFVKADFGSTVVSHGFHYDSKSIVNNWVHCAVRPH